ncbi:MAG: nicotinate-nucleotide adenylyltransferase [Lachnospiraceae bacterium]|nr:nicotinate-nucleotide adenylyltransferase [Lachnospiraceae bacterium]
MYYKGENCKKTGIIGGTFNPIHTGHLILAENAYDSLKLSKVIFMPTGQSYLKDPAGILDGKKRLELINVSIEDNDHFISSDYEMKKPGNTYTCETLSELNLLYPDDELYFIIGEDSVYNIEIWKRPDIIFDNCVLIVAPRGHEPDAKLMGTIRGLEEKYQARICLLDTPDIDISSSMIRRRVSAGQSIKYYVTDKAEQLIKKYGYYRLSDQIIKE